MKKASKENLESPIRGAGEIRTLDRLSHIFQHLRITDYLCVT
jgi:hypothetical protein